MSKISIEIFIATLTAEIKRYEGFTNAKQKIDETFEYYFTDSPSLFLEALTTSDFLSGFLKAENELAVFQLTAQIIRCKGESEWQIHELDDLVNDYFFPNQIQNQEILIKAILKAATLHPEVINVIQNYQLYLGLESLYKLLVEQNIVSKNRQ